MRIHNLKLVNEFIQEHADARTAIEAWVVEVRASAWQKPQEIKDRYASASFLADNRVVFNIKGNNYRLVVQINYAYQIVQVRFLGTHAEYDRIDAESI